MDIIEGWVWSVCRIFGSWIMEGWHMGKEGLVDEENKKKRRSNPSREAERAPFGELQRKKRGRNREGVNQRGNFVRNREFRERGKFRRERKSKTE